MNLKKRLFTVVSMLGVSMFGIAQSAELHLNETAPTFTTQNQKGEKFDLQNRKGKWTILYFYPKADTPGCTKQACAFRDSIDKTIRPEGAEVFGISTDTVADQAAFHKKHHLNFDLLADPDGKIVGMYGNKMPLVKYAKRWTFILDPELKIRQITKDVDPVKDAERTAEELRKLKASHTK